MKNRIEYLDIVRGICIVYMIIGHIGFSSNIYDHYIHAFHMPIFFLVSGYFFKDNNLSLIEYIKKMIKKILIPYFLWSFFFLIIDSKTPLGTHTRIIENLKYIFTINNVRMPIAGALWFLTSFFFCNLMFNILNKLFKNDKIIGILSISIMLIGIGLSKYFNINLWWSLNSSLVGVGIYYLGYLFKKLNIVSKVSTNNILIIIIMFIIHFFLIMKTSYVNMRTGTYPNVILFIVNILLSVIVYINLSKKIEKYDKIKTTLFYLGRESMIPLCLNQFIILIYSKLFSKFIANIFLLKSAIIIFSLLTLILLVKKISNSKLKILFGR